jgi:hypothetical protein
VDASSLPSPPLPLGELEDRSLAVCFGVAHANQTLGKGHLDATAAVTQHAFAPVGLHPFLIHRIRLRWVHDAS